MNILQKLYRWIVRRHAVKHNAYSYSQVTDHKHYFVMAQSWFDDIYTQAVSRLLILRTVIIFLVTIVIGLLGCMAYICVHKHPYVIVIHYYDHGRVWVEPLRSDSIVHNSELIKSEIQRYVSLREMLDPYSQEYAMHMIHIMSSSRVWRSYMRSLRQERHVINGSSKAHAYQNVIINNIVILQQPKHTADQQHVVKKNSAYKSRSSSLMSGQGNLAEVNFTVVIHDMDNAIVRQIPQSVLISWRYLGRPDNPFIAWHNWDGFQVIEYQVSRRHV